MKRTRGSELLIFVALGITGCATHMHSDNAVLRDSSLSNLNPAPKFLAPPSDNEKGEPQIDPVYLSSQADYHFTMGEALSLEGKSERAIEEFKLTLVYDPLSIVVRMRLAAEYVRQGLLSEALEQAEESVHRDPESEEARLLLGGLYSTLKMYDQSLAQYQALIKSHPDNVDAPIYIGAIFAEQKKYDEAVAHFYRLAANHKYKSPEKAYYYIGRIRAEQGSEPGDEKYRKEAEQAYNKALQALPEYAEAVLALANMWSEAGKDEQGLKLLRSFQEKFGPNREIARQLSRVYLEKEQFDKAFDQLEILEGFERDNLNVRVQLALILIEQKKYEQAIIRLEDILAAAPELDKIRYYLGAVYEEMKSNKLATQNYAMIPPSSVYYMEAVLHSANLYKGQGQQARAIEVLSQAIQLRDDIPQFYAFYATLLDDLKQYKEAVAMLSGAVEKFPSHAQLHFFLGSMKDRTGDSPGTIAEMKKVLEIDENHVQALNYLAYTYAEQGKDLDAAEDLARRALAMQPTDGYILDTVGWIMFKRGKLDVAIRYLEAAIKAKSDEAIIAEHLGDAYYRNQLVDRAKVMYRRAADLEGEPARQEKIRQKLTAIDNQRETGVRTPASQAAPKKNP